MMVTGSMFVMVIAWSAFCLFLLYSSYHETYNPYDPKKMQFGHMPRMKYFTKLSCGQVIARLWTDSYGPFDYKFGKEEDGTYTFTINRMNGGYGYTPGSAKYKVLVMSEQEGSAVHFLILDYKASEYTLNVFAWELRRFLEKKLEAVRIE
ncbi:MAG: hypothetical protein J6D08_13275 [Lachnospiraceae bacterium]|nr:hypothetical protein [Lachnospiraceae bacterium]